MIIGEVVTFEQHVGLGTVEAEAGERYEFHCTQIAGGTRTIEVGTPVRFRIVSRYKGRLEAYEVTAVPPR